MKSHHNCINRYHWSIKIRLGRFRDLYPGIETSLHFTYTVTLVIRIVTILSHKNDPQRASLSKPVETFRNHHEEPRTLQPSHDYYLDLLIGSQYLRQSSKCIQTWSERIPTQHNPTALQNFECSILHETFCSKQNKNWIRVLAVRTAPYHYCL